LAALTSYSDVTVVPRIAVTLPLALPLPDGFDVERLQTWPTTNGRLEFVAGRLEYMPPCGEAQQRTAADVVTELSLWRRTHPGFVVGGNEAGMLLGGEVRAADAAVWRSAPATDGLARTAPILVVEVAGVDDTEALLEAKARWYLAHGVGTVWIVVPEARTAKVVTAQGQVVVGGGNARMPEPAGLSGLTPTVASFFAQMEG
jgi:Uma2 family endonuclease